MVDDEQATDFEGGATHGDRARWSDEVASPRASDQERVGGEKTMGELGKPDRCDSQFETEHCGGINPWVPQDGTWAAPTEVKSKHNSTFKK